jgi:hypothetical protein
MLDFNHPEPMNHMGDIKDKAISPLAFANLSCGYLLIVLERGEPLFGYLPAVNREDGVSRFVYAVSRKGNDNDLRVSPQNVVEFVKVPLHLGTSPRETQLSDVKQLAERRFQLLFPVYQGIQFNWIDIGFPL